MHVGLGAVRREKLLPFLEAHGLKFAEAHEDAVIVDGHERVAAAAVLHAPGEDAGEGIVGGAADERVEKDVADAALVVELDKKFLRGRDGGDADLGEELAHDGLGVGGAEVIFLDQPVDGLGRAVFLVAEEGGEAGAEPDDFGGEAGGERHLVRVPAGDGRHLGASPLGLGLEQIRFQQADGAAVEDEDVAGIEPLDEALLDLADGAAPNLDLDHALRGDGADVLVEIAGDAGMGGADLAVFADDLAEDGRVLRLERRAAALEIAEHLLEFLAGQVAVGISEPDGAEDFVLGPVAVDGEADDVLGEDRRRR